MLPILFCQLALFTKHYTLNRLPGQATKPSAESDVEKGAGWDREKNDDADIMDNAIDRSKSVASQKQEQENLEAGVVPTQPELPLKPAMNV